VAKVFITGSSDGLGLMAARILIQQGHQVVLHGRNRQRAEAALDAARGAAHAVFGDRPRLRRPGGSPTKLMRWAASMR
jgi:NAD(P)-dependent dehydrogenase (short-subunit alcohol dehydrogenase family)